TASNTHSRADDCPSSAMTPKAGEVGAVTYVFVQIRLLNQAACTGSNHPAHVSRSPPRPKFALFAELVVTKPDFSRRINKQTWGKRWTKSKVAFCPAYRRQP